MDTTVEPGEVVSNTGGHGPAGEGPRPFGAGHAPDMAQSDPPARDRLHTGPGAASCAQCVPPSAVTNTVPAASTSPRDCELNARVTRLGFVSAVAGSVEPSTRHEAPPSVVIASARGHLVTSGPQLGKQLAPADTTPMPVCGVSMSVPSSQRDATTSPALGSVGAGPPVVVGGAVDGIVVSGVLLGVGW